MAPRPGRFLPRFLDLVHDVGFEKIFAHAPIEERLDMGELPIARRWRLHGERSYSCRQLGASQRRNFAISNVGQNALLAIKRPATLTALAEMDKLDRFIFVQGLPNGQTVFPFALHVLGNGLPFRIGIDPIEHLLAMMLRRFPCICNRHGRPCAERHPRPLARSETYQ